MTKDDYESLQMEKNFIEIFDINTHKEFPFTGHVFGAIVWVSNKYKETVLNAHGRTYKVNEEKEIDFSGNVKMNHD